MGGSHAWRAQVTGEDWMRDIEKRVLSEERRPSIQTAADLLGPGISAFSALITNWNVLDTAFNGFYHSTPGATNSPGDNRYWMGISQATDTGSGLQRVAEYFGHPVDVAWPRFTYLRRFSVLGHTDGLTGRALASSAVRVFSQWRVEDNTPPGMISEYAIPEIAPNGWVLCDGSLLPVNDYPDLFGVITTYFNQAGDPDDQFRLPELVGKVIKL